jgi:hypothetical protein
MQSAPKWGKISDAKMSEYDQPIFALDPSADWDDLTNAMEASVQYQVSEHGKFGSMFAFAPMTEPANPDAWEPLADPPQNLLAASIERKLDARLLKAFKQAEGTAGPLLLQSSPESPVWIDELKLIADVYDQMEKFGITAFCRLGTHENDVSFFFLRGLDGILAVNERLRRNRGKP